MRHLKPSLHLVVYVVNISRDRYVRRSTLNMTSLNTADIRKGISRLYHIVENDFATAVTTK